MLPWEDWESLTQGAEPLAASPCVVQRGAGPAAGGGRQLEWQLLLPGPGLRRDWEQHWMPRADLGHSCAGRPESVVPGDFLTPVETTHTIFKVATERRVMISLPLTGPGSNWTSTGRRSTCILPAPFFSYISSPYFLGLLPASKRGLFLRAPPPHKYPFLGLLGLLIATLERLSGATVFRCTVILVTARSAN